MVDVIPVEVVKRAIAYYYLIAFCPTAKIDHFRDSSAPLRRRIVQESGMTETDFNKIVLPQVCWRIVSFHQDSQEPSKEMVDALVERARMADNSPEDAYEFQRELAQVAELPGRSKPDNRLHRKKGCRLCFTPCYFGYFTLVSEPHFLGLQRIFDEELQKPVMDQNAVLAVLAFTRYHLWRTMGVKMDLITPHNTGNLAYCLLMLGIAKSRYIFPEEKVRTFQGLNQSHILRRAAALNK